MAMRGRALGPAARRVVELAVADRIDPKASEQSAMTPQILAPLPLVRILPEQPYGFSPRLLLAD